METQQPMPVITDEMLKELYTEVLKAAQEKTPPEDRAWWCPKCLKDVKGRFCPDCGTKRTPAMKLKCGGCGTEYVVDSEKAPKFCRSCGKKITTEDLVL